MGTHYHHRAISVAYLVLLNHFVKNPSPNTRTKAYLYISKNVTEISIETALKDFIKGSRRVAILGIGNDLRTDDGVGPFIVNSMNIDSPYIMIENVGSVPEGFARPLADFGAERVIMIDAADMRKPPGHLELVTKDRIGGINISTHSMPLSFLMMYLEQETGGQTILLGVQPKSIQFGEGLTPEIQKVADGLILSLERILEQHIRGLEDV
ncbi:hydrogenase 3 maturation endopeptidase HyCI [Candidatus Thorarchaeota archaeon]|nr:MAG: hydrogenase 3 maturation endopeptidase HyCI [Candidatus Thorarchaeota archaeon]